MGVVSSLASKPLCNANMQVMQVCIGLSRNYPLEFLPLARPQVSNKAAAHVQAQMGKPMGLVSESGLEGDCRLDWDRSRGGGGVARLCLEP